jgi:AcrR family transcriptional regulator
LLEAAARISHSKRTAAVSVREVAAAAGVSKPALYYHFQSKHGLVEALRDEADRRLATLVRETVRRPGSGRERIIAVCEDICRLLEEQPHLLDLLQDARAFHPSPALASRPSRAERLLNGALERVLLEEQLLGRISVRDLVAVRFVVLCLLLGAVRRGRREELSIARLLQPVFDGMMPLLERKADGAEVPTTASGGGRRGGRR